MAQPISGEKLARALEQAQMKFMPYARRAMIRCLVIVKGIIAPYPPQPDRMRSGRLNTYVRGIGSYPKSAFSSNPSAAGGFNVKKKKGGKINHSSQQMDKKWREYVVVGEKEVNGTLRNEATYSGWVSGSKDQGSTPHQVPFHTATGWANKDDSLKQAMPAIEAEIDGTVDDFLKAIGA